MKKAVIWDLDGTLFDSYDVIVESVHLTFQEHGFEIPKDEIHRYAIKFSMQSLFAEVSKEKDIPIENLHHRYSQISSGRYLDIRPMRNALEILHKLETNGVENYVFTHRGKTTLPVLENLNMTAFFHQIITSQSGFARKPDPEGLVYLMKKHNLCADGTYYVGDRCLDMDCAKNAGIPGVLYLPQGSIDVSGGSETYVIHDLIEIMNIV